MDLLMLGLKVGAARTDVNKALALDCLGHYEQAIQLIQAARSTFVAESEQLEIARTDLNLGLIHYRVGHYRQALLNLEDARTKFQKLNNAMEVATVDLHKVKIYLQINQLPEAIAIGKRARTIVNDEHNLHRYAAVADFDVGLALARIGERDAAWVHMTEAKAAMEKLGLPFQAAQIDLERAWLLSKPHDWATDSTATQTTDLLQAEMLVNDVLERLKEGSVFAMVPKAQIVLARINHLQHNDSVARDHYLQALNALEETGPSELRYLAFEGLGNVFEKLNAPTQALIYYQQAIEIAMTIADRLVENEARTGFLYDKLGTFDRAIVLCFEAGQTNRALQLMEYIRVGHWANVQEYLEPDDTDLGHIGLIERMKELRSRWHQEYIRLQQLHTDVRDTDFRDPQRTIPIPHIQQSIESELTEAIRTLRLYTVQNKATQNADKIALQVSVASLSKQLSSNSCLLFYHFSHDCVHILLIAATHFQTKKVHIPQAELHRHIDRLYFALRWQDENVMTQLHRLWQILIQPLEPDLSRYKNLLIIPHERLYHLPFHALHDGTEYLMNRYAVTYLPAAAMLYQQTDRLEQSFHHKAAMHPQCSPTVYIFGCSRGGKLQGTLEEAKKISATFATAKQQVAISCRLYLETEATQQSLLAHGPQADILHLAAHAQFRHDNPWFSNIHLSDDTPLLLIDLAQMKLTRAPLVVLSACETGIGDLKGADVLGLSHAFLRAGAGALVVSLWQVPNDATSCFMEIFYQHIAAGMTPAQALNRARHTLLAHPNFTHPFHWAGWSFIRCYKQGRG
ncbi:CHAT domain-containing protein [Chloroflexi bacterium TSY]|nr:CHAT domain-containing protein [Chloroflexi bacterium TSY]